MTFWTEERVDVFARLAGDGLSASQIAAELGATRSAVIGKSHRTGIKLKGFHGPQGTRKPRRPNPPGPVMFKAAPPIAPATAAEPPSLYRRNFFALRNESCRWPVTDEPPHKFCGTPQADFAGAVPYCAWHARIAYRQPGEREAA